MASPASRRAFLRTSAVGGMLAGCGDLGFLGNLGPLSAREVKNDPRFVRFAPDTEPLVRLLEDTPRNKVLEAVAEKIRGGTKYKEILAALQLAGIRNVQPRPSVGFKFHAVLVVNSAHLAAQASPDEHRWLPIFWAIDNFKQSQARDVQEGDWTMPAVDESAVPDGAKAPQLFVEAMDSWDEAKADTAAAALVRSENGERLFDTFARYGARDFRSIGHKAIYVANAWRTLQSIGKQHAEPIFRSLAYALLNHEGAGNPAQNDYDADRPWRKNQELIKLIPSGWQGGKPNEQATRDLLAALYDCSHDEACEHVVELLDEGVAPQSIWDALFLGAGELLMRQPGIVGLHTLTTTNAMHFAYQNVKNDETKRLLLLQNAAFLPMFRDAMVSRGRVGKARITELEPASGAEASDDVSNLFAAISRDRTAAAKQALAYVESHDDIQPLVDAARLLVFFKGRDSHDYKFSSAVFEDYGHLSPQWRNRFVAASMFNLVGSGERDNPLVERTRAALS